MSAGDGRPRRQEFGLLRTPFGDGGLLVERWRRRYTSVHMIGRVGPLRVETGHAD